MFISTTTLLICAVAGLAAYLIGGALFRKDTQIENRRKAAAKVAQTLSDFGLVRLPSILTDYSVGDYSGMAHSIHDFGRLCTSDPEVVLKEFNKVADRVLERKLTTPEGRALIAAKLAAAEPTTSIVTAVA